MPEGANLRQTGQRLSSHTHELSHLVPHGCSLRRYEPIGKAPYWHGRLPRGMVDRVGRYNHILRWGFYTGRTEDETIDIMVVWCNKFGRAQDDA